MVIPALRSSRRDDDLALIAGAGAGESTAGLYGYPRSISSLNRVSLEETKGQCTASIYIVQTTIQDCNIYLLRHSDLLLHGKLHSLPLFVASNVSQVDQNDFDLVWQ